MKMYKEGNKVELIVPHEYDGILMRDFLLEKQQISKKGLCQLKNKGAILCNTNEVTVRQKLIAGDRVVLIYPLESVSEYLLPEIMDLHIVYEDKDITVLNKPAYICVHPTKTHPSGTLANGLLAHWNKKGEKVGFHAVNRLDKDTSGLILVAKNSYAKQQLFLQQQKQEIKRHYLALVHGKMHKEKGVIDAPIKKIEGKTVQREIHGTGQRAVTHYNIVITYNEATLVELWLETGRTHQIRVHLSHIGHPLLGDKLYGGDERVMKRQALHAKMLCFKHPRTKQALSFHADLPADIQLALNWMEEEHHEKDTKTR